MPLDEDTLRRLAALEDQCESVSAGNPMYWDECRALSTIHQQQDEIRQLRAEVERLQVHEAFHAVAVQQRDEAWARIDRVISKFRQEVERLREAALAAYHKGHYHTCHGGYQWCDQGSREVVEEIIREAMEEE